MHGWIVLSLQRNQADSHAVDLELALDAPHHRFVPKGNFVREQLIDGKKGMASWQ